MKTDLPPVEQRRAHLAGCMAILGADYDSMAPIWREATRADRLFLLRMAQLKPTPEECRFSSAEAVMEGWARQPWGAIPAHQREAIRFGLQKFEQWAAKLREAKHVRTN